MCGGRVAAIAGLEAFSDAEGSPAKHQDGEVAPQATQGYSRSRKHSPLQQVVNQGKPSCILQTFFLEDRCSWEVSYSGVFLDASSPSLVLSGRCGSPDPSTERCEWTRPSQQRKESSGRHELRSTSGDIPIFI